MKENLNIQRWILNDFLLQFQAEDSIDVLAKLNNKKIGSKHIAIRYAKNVDAVDDGKSSKNFKIPALAAGSVTKSSIADKRSKIQQIEEQLKNLQSRSNDFEINLNKSGTPSEPLIKKYQFNKDAPATNSGRYQSYNKRRRKPYWKRIYCSLIINIEIKSI